MRCAERESAAVRFDELGPLAPAELPAPRCGPTVPTELVVWGTYAKPVPFALKNAPLVGGTK